jgi:hypothetical protein
MVEWKYTLFSAHSCPSRLVNLSPRYGSVIELIQARLELANRFSPVYISPMCNLYSQTRNVEAVLRLSRAAQPRVRDRAAAHDLYWMDGSVPDCPARRRAALSQPRVLQRESLMAVVIRKAKDGARAGADELGFVPTGWQRRAASPMCATTGY